MKLTSLLFLIGFSVVFAQHYEQLSQHEIDQIKLESHEMMRVMKKTSHCDSLILKDSSKPIDPKDPMTKLLADRMLLSVQDPLNSGVGIAAPQVGINRRMFIFQRFDKPNQPFELAINPEIIWESSELSLGNEGDLSFDENGLVYRNHQIKVKYFDLNGNEIIEDLQGFTAIIFQHERDHLDGILLVDRIEQQKKNKYQLINAKTNLYQLVGK